MVLSDRQSASKRDRCSRYLEANRVTLQKPPLSMLPGGVIFREPAAFDVPKSISRIATDAPLEVPPGFEPGMEVLQTSALPLGYGTEERATGLEPATSTLARLRSTN